MPSIKKYLLAGLLVWVPLVVTLFVLNWAFNIVDGLFIHLTNIAAKLLSTDQIHILQSIQKIPGIGALFILIILCLTGLFATNFIGKWGLDLGNRLLNRIPIVKSIYSTVKQVSDTVFSDNGNAFKQAVLIPYPHAHTYTIGFITGSSQKHADLEFETTPVFVPTTPNPTSGFLLMVRSEDIKQLGMTVDEALKYVVSLGVVKNNLQ